ncbi:cytochrome P450 4d2-like [Chrysoperla carnea]|uniref:cytochrome P450 4d2-like n=1 Tax=Chrysoperla carnea TaxID=189513 RepID=UPI001D07CD00|nr:cytochrome P450 4d2-like [Chrysoperla carnea]
MLWLIIQISVTLFIGLLVVLYLQQLQKSKKILLPSPPLIPLLGHALEFGSTAQDIHNNILRLVSTYGKLFTVWVGPFNQYCIISDSDVTNKILSSTKLIEKSGDYDLIKPWLGDGLLISKGTKWFKRRKMLTPAFHFTILEQSINTFTEASDRFIENLKKHVNGDTFDVYPYVTLLGLDIICKTAMGIDLNVQTQPDSEYVTAVRDMCRIIFERVFSAVQQSDFIFYNFTANGKTFKNGLGILHSMTNKVIEERRQLLINDIKNNEVKDNGPEKTKDDISFGEKKEKMVFMDVLLKSTIDGKPLTNSDIQEEVDTFMFEGHDTVSSGISFTLYLLANHPEIQTRAFEEVRDICGDNLNDQPSLSDLNKMPYLEAIIKESMRLYPPVPVILRNLSEDLQLDNCVLPKHTRATIVIYCIHRNPEYFSDPESFKPERFLEETQNKNYFSYVPFSAGSRNCIGQKFAMYEMKSTLSKVLRHYELCSAGPQFDLKLAMAVILKSLNGVNIKVRPRIYK